MSDRADIFEAETFLFDITRHGDSRGYVAETFRDTWLPEIAPKPEWVLELQSYSAQKNTLRGLHFQIGEFCQAKMVRCIRGAIFDVIVDLRQGSDTFGRYLTFTLDADKPQHLFVPKGFAHGFMTLTDEVELLYKCDAYYSRNHERGIRWNDPDIAAPWPLSGEAHLSEKDLEHPFLKETPTYFRMSDNPYSAIVEPVTAA